MDSNKGMRGLTPKFSTAELLGGLPDMGEPLSLACVHLHLEPTLDRVDELAARLPAAQNAICRLRRMFAESDLV